RALARWRTVRPAGVMPILGEPCTRSQQTHLFPSLECSFLRALGATWWNEPHVGRREGVARTATAKDGRNLRPSNSAVKHSRSEPHQWFASDSSTKYSRRSTNGPCFLVTRTPKTVNDSVPL